MSNNDVIHVKLDKERVIKYRRAELKLIEQMFGLKIGKINFEDLGVDEVTQMLHLGLIHEDANLQLDAVEKLADAYPFFGELMEKVIEAYVLSMGGPKAHKKYLEEKAKAEGASASALDDIKNE